MLEAEDLAAFRGERLVFAGLRFAVPAGGALVLTEPNGAGKTTLLRVLAGLVPRPRPGACCGRAQDALADRSRMAARAISAIRMR